MGHLHKKSCDPCTQSPLFLLFLFPLLLPSPLGVHFPSPPLFSLLAPPPSLISLSIPSLISLMLLFSSSFPFSSLSLFPSSLPFSFVSLFLSSTLFSFYFRTLVELLLYHLSLLLPHLLPLATSSSSSSFLILILPLNILLL